MGRTDSADSSVSYKVYKNSTNGLVSCGTGSVVSNGGQTLWQIKDANGQDPSTCGFVAGDSILFKINLDAHLDANAYVGNLSFAFKNNSN